VQYVETSSGLSPVILSEAKNLWIIVETLRGVLRYSG
jgi:hypothetical protein